MQMIDKDGRFLSLLLTEESPGITCPVCLSYDVNTNFLWVGAMDRNTVSVYKYISGRFTSRLIFDKLNDYLYTTVRNGDGLFVFFSAFPD